MRISRRSVMEIYAAASMVVDRRTVVYTPDSSLSGHCVYHQPVMIQRVAVVSSDSIIITSFEVRSIS